MALMRDLRMTMPQLAVETVDLVYVSLIGTCDDEAPA